MKKYRILRISSLNMVNPTVEYWNYNKIFTNIEDAKKEIEKGLKGNYQHLIVEFEDIVSNENEKIIYLQPK